MIIELRGVEFVNKGAELMLHAIIDKVRQEFPDALFVMETTARAPRNKHLENNIYSKSWLNLQRKRKKVTFDKSFVYNLIPASKRRQARYVSEKEIDVVLDGSGFAFGDQWGARKAGIRLADQVKDWKAQGKKVIMLPQALGPFTDPELVAKMKTITRYTDLIFARDKISYDYITALAAKTDNIRLKPDFTNLIKGAVPNSFKPENSEVAIIPNSKMIETADKKDGEAYMTLLQRLITMTQKAGKKPFFLIHESQSDGQIADATNKALEKKIPVIHEENPLYVKGIIGASQAVITSRFHGLVSCLSQAVPCLSTGWSHKYEMLLQDYAYPEALLDVHSDDETLQQKIDMILQEPSRSQIAEKLRQEGKKQKQLSEAMWQEVFNKIRG